VVLDPATAGTHAAQREARIIALREHALKLLADLTLYCENDIPLEATWGDIEFQADVNKALRDLRDRVFHLGEYAPPGR
jgi:hypothetical protein